MQTDSFQGIWIFDVERSTLRSAPPHKWVQSVRFEGKWLRVREEITNPTGTWQVAVEAIPDGGFFPLSGSSVADEISYSIAGATIAGVARKGGTVTFRESMDFSEPGTMVSDLLLVVNGEEVPLGRACFKRELGSEVPPNVPAWLPTPW